MTIRDTHPNSKDTGQHTMFNPTNSGTFKKQPDVVKDGDLRSSVVEIVHIEEDETEEQR
jgi:hypothetical protein